MYLVEGLRGKDMKGFRDFPSSCDDGIVTSCLGRREVEKRRYDGVSTHIREESWVNFVNFEFSVENTWSTFSNYRVSRSHGSDNGYICVQGICRGSVCQVNRKRLLVVADKQGTFTSLQGNVPVSAAVTSQSLVCKVCEIGRQVVTHLDDLLSALIQKRENYYSFVGSCPVSTVFSSRTVYTERTKNNNHCW